MSKSAQDRIDDTLNYIKTVNSPNYHLLERWVYHDSVHELKSLSKALSLGLSWFKRGGTSSDDRRAMRGCLLARIAAERPGSLDVTKAWQSSYQSKNEAQLRTDTVAYLRRLRPPRPTPPTGAVPLSATAFGLSTADLQSAKSALSAPTATVVRPSDVAPPPAPKVADFATMKNFFEKSSRIHVVLSGHGSWMSPHGSIQLGKQQTLRTYIPHHYGLGNNIGQLIDNRQFPAPLEEYPGGSMVPNYTLQPRGKLRLLNNSVGDAEFVTVTSNTLLSRFVSNPKWASATFHWAACRVVFSNAGELACPKHNAWEDFKTSCIHAGP